MIGATFAEGVDDDGVDGGGVVGGVDGGGGGGVYGGGVYGSGMKMIGGKKTTGRGLSGSNTVVDEDATPGPTAFTARSRTSYVVPLVRTVIVTGLVVSTGDSEVHVAPEFNEYW